MSTSPVNGPRRGQLGSFACSAWHTLNRDKECCNSCRSYQFIDHSLRNEFRVAVQITFEVRDIRAITIPANRWMRCISRFCCNRDLVASRVTHSNSTLSCCSLVMRILLQHYPVTALCSFPVDHRSPIISAPIERSLLSG